MSDDSFFEVGRRYRNRKGKYEVVHIDSSGLHVLYDDGTTQVISNLALQERIVRNVQIDTEEVMPYPRGSLQNEKYFRALGFLSVAGRFEAIVPPKSQAGFEKNYEAIKGQRPVPGQSMYYLHKDRNVDKWGSELRITFDTNENTLRKLNFGPNVNVVRSPSGEYRINSNGLIWRLWELGFELGDNQQEQLIRPNIPDEYVDAYADGRKLV